MQLTTSISYQVIAYKYAFCNRILSWNSQIYILPALLLSLIRAPHPQYGIEAQMTFRNRTCGLIISRLAGKGLGACTLHEPDV